MGPGPFWIENKKLENPQKNEIFDDYLFLGIKYCQNTVSKLHFTRLPPLHELSYLPMSLIGFQKKTWIGGRVCVVKFIFFAVWNCFNFARPLTYCLVFFCSVLYIVCTVNAYIYMKSEKKTIKKTKKNMQICRYLSIKY